MNNEENGLIFDNNNQPDTTSQTTNNNNNMTIDYNQLYGNQNNVTTTPVQTGGQVTQQTATAPSTPVSEDSTSTPLENENVKNNNDVQINNKGTIIFILIIFALLLVTMIFVFPYLFKKTF